MELDLKTSQLQYFAAGVFKVAHSAAGYPDLLAVAREWAKDPGFVELIVRKVSKDNWGIQFVYASEAKERPIESCREQLRARYGESVCAVDFCQNCGERCAEGLVVLKHVAALRRGVRNICACSAS
jgi:hypothetical protein